jgi:hypothetical protein
MSSRNGRIQRAKQGSRSRWLTSVLLGIVGSGYAQDRSFLPQTSPAPIFQPQQSKDYNLKWGKLTGRFYGSFQTEFNDNINLAPQGEKDLILSPTVGIGFLWPMDKDNTMQLDLGVGYRYYVDHSNLSSWNITPDTRWNYHWRAREDLRFVIHDAFRTVIDPVERPELSAANGKTSNFRRWNNDVGVQATYQFNSKISATASYDYVVDRSFNSDFTELDRDDQTFGLGQYYEVNDRLLLGVTEAYTITEYLRNVQNNGTSLTIGPVATYKVNQFLTLDASVGYTYADFDQSGTIADTSGYGGITWQVGAKHILNSRASHNIRFARSLMPGLGSNYSETTSLQYSIFWKYNTSISLNGTFSWESLDSSGGGEQAQRFLTYIGANMKISRRWNAGLSYGFAWKDSEFAGRDYTQNRVTLDINRAF